MLAVRHSCLELTTPIRTTFSPRVFVAFAPQHNSLDRSIFGRRFRAVATRSLSYSNPAAYAFPNSTVDKDLFASSAAMAPQLDSYFKQ